MSIISVRCFEAGTTSFGLMPFCAAAGGPVFIRLLLMGRGASSAAGLLAPIICHVNHLF
jgi:hypothetical protein